MISSMPVIGSTIAVLKRRRWYFLIPFIIILLVSTIVALLLPKTYVSEGKIGVESQQIPENFVRSTITTVAGERVGMMEERVLTNARLEDVIGRLHLYQKDWNTLPMSELTERFKDNVEVAVIVDPYASRLGAIAFTVAFEDREPEAARAVATELVSMFLEENISSRTERAAETTDFLDRQAQALEEQARSVDQKIAQFKQKHRNALPEHLELKVNMVARAESDLRSVEMEIATIEQELRFLQSRNMSATFKSDGDSSTGSSALSLPEQLEAKRAELAQKLLKYRPDHWDIKRLEAEVLALDTQIKNADQTVGKKDGSKTAQSQTRTDSQYHTIASRLTLLRGQEKSLRGDIKQLQDEILEIPLVEIELRRLTDQYNVYMQEFGEIRSKKHDATLAQNLEQEQKAERFILLEPPELPLDPKRPMSKMLAIALLLSLGGGAGVVYLAEALDDRIYGRAMLTSLTGVPPLAVIPYIENVRGSLDSGRHGNHLLRPEAA